MAADAAVTRLGTALVVAVTVVGVVVVIYLFDVAGADD